MSKDNSLKVYFHEDVLDLKEIPTHVSKRKTPEKSLKSNTETTITKSDRREIRKSTKHTPNPRFSHRKVNARAASVDSRFRRIRSVSPDEDKRSIVTVASHYSASLPIINQKNQDKVKEEREFSQDYSFNALGEGEGAGGMIDLKQVAPSTSKKDVSVTKDDVVAPSEYCTAVYDGHKDLNSHEVTTLLNYKYEYPVRQNWGDPRLIKKYKGLFRPRQLKSSRSSWSLPVYTATDCKIEAAQPKLTEGEEKKNDTNANTYTYEDEESDVEYKKSKLALTYEPGLPWPLYFAACCCGATLVALLAWYALENEVLMKRFRKYFLKEEELERSALSKLTTNVLSTIVYVINRIIKTTTHILVSPRSEVFAPPQETHWWKIY